MKKSLLYIVLAGSSVCFSLAQNIVGDWRGVLLWDTVPAHDRIPMHIAVHITRFDADGSAATIDFYPETGDFFEMGRPVESVSLKDSQLRLGFEGRTYFQGSISADGAVIHGFYWDHDPFPVDLKRTTALANGSSMALKPSNLDGTWVGSLDNYPEIRRVVFNFVTGEYGPTVTADGLGEAKAVPATKLSMRSRIEMEFKSIGVNCWGEFDDTRTTLDARCDIPHVHLLTLKLKRIGASNQPAQSEFDHALEMAGYALTHEDFSAAVKYCEKAVALQPGSVDALRQLGRAYWHLYTPGDPETNSMAEKSEAGFRKAIDLAPDDKSALASLALIDWQRSDDPEQDRVARLHDAKLWLNKLTAVDPQDFEAFYFLGVIDWSEAHTELIAARLEFQKIGAGLRTRIGPLYDDAIKQFANVVRIEESTIGGERTIPLEPEYADAMAYLNLCNRERAALADNKEDYARSIAVAEDWLQKALRAKEAAPNPQRTTSSLFEFPLPSLPAPPPPPPPGDELGSVPGPASPSTTDRIRVKGEAMQSKLVSKVQPVYPQLAKQARVQGAVRFTAIIGPGGDVKDLELIEGHPLLVAAAEEAIRQWVYKPTLVNGKPVEVETEIVVSFTLSK
jgi:TonB family protein